MTDKFLDVVWRAELSYFNHGQACDRHSIIEILHFRRSDGSEYFYVRESLWTPAPGVTDKLTKLAECADRKTAIVWATDYLQKLVAAIPENS
jgi:hypothetical protein